MADWRMGTSSRRLAARNVLTLHLLGSFSLAASTLPPSPSLPVAEPKTFFDAVDVELVELEVWVRDDGAPVLGLEASDFLVREDDTEVELTHFAANEPHFDAVGDAPEPEAMVAAGGDLLLTVFIDQGGLPPNAQAVYGPALERVVSGLRPGDRVMVVAYDREPELALEATTDLAAAVAAGREVLLAGSRGLLAELERKRLWEAIRTAPTAAEDEALQRNLSGSEGKVDPGAAFAVQRELAGAINVYAQQRETAMRRTLAALAESLGRLAGVPGRRSVLLLGEAFEMRPGEQLREAFEQKFAEDLRRSNAAALLPTSGALGLEEALDQVASLAAGLGITLHAMAAGTGEIAQEVGAEVGGGLLAIPHTGPGLDRRDSLARLVEPTGGTLVVRTSAAAADRLASALRPDYVLAYAAASGSDKRPRIDVELRAGAVDGRVTLRHRRWRLTQSAEQRMRARIAAAVASHVEIGNGLGLSLEPGLPTLEGDVLRLPLAVRFDLGKVTLLPQGSHHEGRLAIFVVAKDEHGREAPVTQAALPLRIANERVLTALGQQAVWQTELTLRPEAHTLVVGMRDEVGGLEAAVRTQWHPPAGLLP